jgi:hypothetical protein
VTAAEDQVLANFRARLSQDPEVPAELRGLFEGAEWPKAPTLKAKILEASTSKGKKDGDQS